VPYLAHSLLIGGIAVERKPNDSLIVLVGVNVKYVSWQRTVEACVSLVKRYPHSGERAITSLCRVHVVVHEGVHHRGILERSHLMFWNVIFQPHLPNG